MNNAAENKDKTEQEEGEQVRTLGLLPSPGHCERVAADIADSLSEQLAQSFDDQYTWKVEIVPDPLTGSNVAMSVAMDDIASRKEVHNWDYAISLIDIPIRRDKRIVIGQTGGGLDVAIISIPPLGVFNVRKKVRSMILELVDDMYRGTPSEDATSRFLDGGEARRGLSTEEEADGDLRYTAPPIRGNLRLVAGMVYANRPWRLFPSFKTTVATAFATGGYGLIFQSLWEIGNVYTYARLITLMLGAMTILAIWIIVSHGLWEPEREGVSRYNRSLYNATTALTIATGVTFSYVMIFVMLLGAAVIYIPASLLESTIGHPPSAINYVRIAWVTSSVATIAGAIGAGLEDSEAVQNATFGWRQSNRWKQYSEEQKREEEEENT